MSWLLERWRRVLFLFRKDRFDRDLEEEMAFHLEMRAQSTGDDDTARHVAHRKFGNMTLLKEASRDAWGWRWFERLLQDLRYALRMLRRSPAFTAVAVLSLALGIGANTAIFSLMDAMYWKTPPVRDPEQLVSIVIDNDGLQRQLVPHEIFRQGRDGNAVFTGVFTASSGTVNLAVDGLTDRGSAEAVSGNFFSLLGVPAAMGRVFSTAVVGGSWAPEAVLSYESWQTRFSGDAGIVGKPIQLNGYPFTIVGVLSRGFSGLTVWDATEIRIPKLPEALAHTMPALVISNPNDSTGLFTITTARLRPGVGMQQAQAATEVVYQQFLRGHPKLDTDPKYRGSHIRLREARRQSSVMIEYERPLFLSMGIVAIVLLIACANLASLILARSMARRAEMGIRLAIGAGRARLVRQLLTESLVLSFLGGCLGMVFAFWIGRLLFGFFPPAFARVALNIRPDFRVLLFTSFLSMLTGVFFGLAPALQATKTDPLAVMKGGLPAARRGFNLGNLLVTSEVGLSLVLLMIAGLLVRTLQNLKNVHSGFSAENVVLFSLRPTQEGYTGTRLRQFYMELFRRSMALPGVRAAAVAEGGPLSGREGGSVVAVSNGRPDAEGGDVALNDVVSPRFFETLGIQLLAGRDFAVEDDLARPKVAIADENFVHRFFGDSNPIGRKVLVPDEPEWNAEIIGVVNASKHRSLREPPLPMVYFAILQEAKPFHPSLYIQADGNTAPLIAAVRREVQAVDKDVAVFNVKTLQQQVDESILRERLVATLSGFFGLLAVLLVAVGLYGIIAYAVVRRTREIGIRMAVGADHGDVIRLVMKETIKLATLGIVPGVIAAFGATRLIASQLYAVTPTDTVTLAGAILFLVAVAAIAGYLPARQAAKVDPTVALRYE